MKKLLVSICILSSALVLFGQSEINFDFDKKKFEHYGIDFNKDSRLVIHCDNSAKINFSLSTLNKSFEIKTPDILKPIFMIGPGQSILSNGRNMDNIKDCLIRLNKIVEIGNNLYNSKSSLSDYRKEAKNKIDEIIKLYNSFLVLNSPNSTLKFNYDVEKEQLDKTKEDYKRDQAIINELIKVVAQDYNFVENTNRALIKATEDPIGFLQYIQQLNVIETSDYKNSKNSLIFLVASLEATDEIKSSKFKSTKDILGLSIAFLHPISKDTIYKLKTDLYSKNKVQFSFSSGFFYNQIVDNKYYIESNPDNTSSDNFIRKEETDNFDVAFGALAHCTYRLTAEFGIGLSAGAALSPFDAKTRYLLGGSILIGRKNQFIINGGVAFARREFLSNQVNKEEMLVPKTLTTIPVVSRIDHSIYLGITYNIIKVK